MTARPILDATRSLLRFRDATTIAEIASIAGVPKRRVLDVMNRNGAFVWRDRKTGRITRVDPQSPLRDSLWQSGRFYRIRDYGAWSKEGEQIVVRDEALKMALGEPRTTGGLGDSYQITIIPHTPENIAAVEAAGLRPWSEAVIDDSLWREAV